MKKITEGSVELFYGPMFGGKSSTAQRTAMRHIAAHRKVVIFKPEIDTRGRRGIISSHDGVEYPPKDSEPHHNLHTHVIHRIEQAIELSCGSDVIILEEAQFWSNEMKMIQTLRHFRNWGKIVYIFMLDMTFQGIMWPNFIPIFQESDKKHHLTAICPGLNGEPCGKEASFSKRLSKSHVLVMIGKKDNYQPACYKHFHAEYDPSATQFDPNTLKNSG